MLMCWRRWLFERVCSWQLKQVSLTWSWKLTPCVLLMLCYRRRKLNRWNLKARYGLILSEVKMQVYRFRTFVFRYCPVKLVNWLMKQFSGHCWQNHCWFDGRSWRRFGNLCAWISTIDVRLACCCSTRWWLLRAHLLWGFFCMIIDTCIQNLCLFHIFQHFT